MKLQIVADDGSIQGWFVSFLVTGIRLCMFLGSYFSPGMLDTEQKIGGSFTAFALTSVASWFAYKIIRPATDPQRRAEIPCDHREVEQAHFEN